MVNKRTKIHGPSTIDKFEFKVLDITSNMTLN